jgi:flagellar hook-associated protein 3 FlgL
MSGWGTIYNHTQSALQEHARVLSQLQQQVATGNRLIRPCDSPGEAYRLMVLSSRAALTTTQANNLKDVSSTLSYASDTLQSVADLLPRIKQLLTQAATGSYSQSNRKAIAGELDAMLEQMVSTANTKSLGRYIFGGATTASAPYQVQRINGRISRLDYVGSLNETQVSVAPGVLMSNSLVGDRIFRASGTPSAVVMGGTGAAAGRTTPSARGDVWLTVAHTATTFQAPSQLASGAGAAADTIIGAHTVAVNAAARTMALDDGQEVSFVNGSGALLDDVTLTNAAGDVVHVSAAGWTNFNGVTTVTGAGTLSADDGATSVVISGGADQAVTDSRTGGVIYVDATGIRRSGLDLVRVSGTYDLFGAVITARDLMLNDRNLTNQRQLSLINESLESLDEAAAGLTQSLTTLGGRVGALEGLQESLTSAKDAIQGQISSIQSADLVQLSTELARRQTIYEATLSTSARLLKLSLLDYI